MNSSLFHRNIDNNNIHHISSGERVASHGDIFDCRGSSVRFVSNKSIHGSLNRHWGLTPHRGVASIYAAAYHLRFYIYIF